MIDDFQAKVVIEIGQHVEQDEELATIETDKIDVAVNAPDAGIIREFMAAEDDTVTVDQELVRLDVGAVSKDEVSEQANEKPKSPASDEQATASQPSGGQENSNSQPSRSPQQDLNTSASQEEQKQPSAQSAPESQTKVQEQIERKSESTAGSAAIDGIREERRVNNSSKITGYV